MGKKNKSRKSGGGGGGSKKRTPAPAYEEDESEQRLTLETLDAINTDSEDEDQGNVVAAAGSGILEGSDEEGDEEWDAEAAALRKAIAEGAFDKIGMKVDNKNKGSDDEEEEDEEEESDSGNEGRMEEVALESDSSEDEDDDEEDEEDNESNIKAQKKAELERMQKASSANSKALNVLANELAAVHNALPWSETFTVVPATPLPFGGAGGREGNELDVHDDLKREVAFYNTAMEAVIEARAECERIGLPFRRPDDFFAEMVKTDDHMAKVKDRLIFETKKMDAFEQRKSNKEQRLRAKEKRANKAIEKAKAKKDHFKAVDEWAKSAAANRVPGAMRDDDDFQLSQLGPNKKRERADRKYGHGGKRGRFKQNDQKTLNDMSGFNPRGNFGGMGTKSGKHKSGGSGSGGGGAKRKGKRARDAARSRR